MLSAFELARPLLLALDPERAHALTLRLLEAGLYPRGSGGEDARLAVDALGLAFPNPFGVAAGFDKDARVAQALLAMGFGHAEVGTVTPLPQAGNPRPRVFRLAAERAIINRLGFNNAGHAAALERLSAGPRHGIVGVNIGANRDAPDRIGDYVTGLERFYDVASYVSINVSSPNTPGLRDLQAPANLDALLARLEAARARQMAAGKPRRALVVKLAPDLAAEDLAPMVEVMLARGIDAIAVSNTTLARPGLARHRRAHEAGGLSGRPLFYRSTVLLARTHLLTAGRVPLIGVGGIDSAFAAIAKIEAGASLLQLYTGLVYVGPGLLGALKQGLAAYAQRAGLARISEATGVRAASWAAKPLER
jgi:dihydroorotate dehydrogenase